MADERVTAPESPAMTSEQAGRWETVLDTLAGMLPPGAVRVLVDGAGGEDVPRLFADRLAASVSAAGRRTKRRYIHAANRKNQSIVKKAPRNG
ncbi:hypothetical protein I7412_37080 [Frankia sp. CN6]|uniref:Uncharacterized protein n=1 Tax=Frankia nepalensis TaxID=1836974 RepID=A0A937USN3_9ACTN|nr:hypothetical protein [Frankia nepalensis]MBL7632672.1 hypothetical protein [Frankia nepalensis]